MNVAAREHSALLHHAPLCVPRCEQGHSGRVEQLRQTRWLEKAARVYPLLLFAGMFADPWFR